MGCFWEPAEALLKLDGVIDTVSGYTGNEKFDADPSKTLPNYDSVCFGRDWVEGVRVTYDTDKISYESLLDAFFEAQKPQLGSRQYGSIIFPHDEEQLKLAQQWQQGSVLKRDSDGFQNDWTQIEYPRTKFYAAEGYHQNYWQKQRPRFALIFVLLLISTGLGDHFYGPALEEAVKTFANGATIAVGLAITAERFLDSKVAELD
jgi:peptide-methionine (S)-S-oxide reductase